MPSVTLIVLTKNEAPRIARCLASCQALTDELLVIDSGSTDDTVSIARGLGATVVQRDWPGRAAQSNHAASLVKTDWYFQLDADEVSTPELNDAIRLAMENDLPGVVGYTADRLEHFLGRWVRCGSHHDVLRLCRTGHCTMAPQRAHAPWVADGEVKSLHRHFLHHVDQPLSELLVKLNHRGMLSALDYHERGLTCSYGKLLWHPLATFLRLMILKGGVLDGLPGLILAGLRTSSCFARMVRLHELQQEAARES